MVTNSHFWMAIILASVASFVLGFIWYSLLFSKAWKKEIGMSDEQLKETNMGMIFGTTFVLTFVMAIFLARMIPEESTWLIGLRIGAKVGITFVATTFGINYLFQRKSVLLWLIDAGYQVTALAIMGAVMGGWT